jgi:hypothetical protein
MSGQVVDTESAREFMKEALARISEEETGALLSELRDKSARFQALLAPGRVAELSEEELRRLFRSVFSTRRTAGRMLRENGVQALRDRIVNLLYGRAPIATRFQQFCEAFKGAETTTGFDFASELLHYTLPAEYWLWTRWMWNPRNGVGALRLVTLDGCELRGSDLGETYLRVGEAVAFVSETARAAGLQRADSGLFGTTIYLCLVYIIYMYTTLRLRMTQEFNKVIPELPELARRILGVYRLEV